MSKKNGLTLNTRKKILVLDDEFIIAMDIADQLKDEGFDIAGPYSRVQAVLDNLETDEPDAALLDVNLGRGETSYELALMLLKRGIPFTFLTGYSEFAPPNADLKNSRRVGKPVSTERLRAEVKALLA